MIVVMKTLQFCDKPLYLIYMLNFSEMEQKHVFTFYIITPLWYATGT